MISLKVSIDIKDEPSVVWSYLTVWKNHERWIPFTTITLEDNGFANEEVGTVFTGITSLIFKLIDPMIVRESVAPISGKDDIMNIEGSGLYNYSSGYLKVQKIGTQVKGFAGFTVEPKLDTQGRIFTTLTWWEEIETPHTLFKPFEPLISKIASFLFMQSIKKMKRDIENDKSSLLQK